MDRRIFLHRFARGGMLASLVLLTGVLISRRQVSVSTACSGDYPCRRCRDLQNCALPEAMKERENG
jgi:hypothetical protein